MIALSVDIGGTSSKIAFITDKGDILWRYSIPTENNPNPDEMVHQISSVIKEAMKNDQTLKPVALGVGCPGIISSSQGICGFSNNLGWRNVNVKALFQKELGLETFIDNDANVALLGEVGFGVGKCYKNLVLLTLGTGVGSGIYIDGKLYSGTGNEGAELGHTLLYKDGLPCSCGRNGCLEAYVSVKALKQQTAKAMEEHPDSLIWKICPSINKVKGETVFRAVEQGDKVAKDVLNQYISYLGEGCINIINAFRPEAIILSGGLSKEGEGLRKPLTDYLTKRKGIGEDYAHSPEILVSTLGADMGIFGGAALVFEHHKSDDFSKKGTGYVANLIRKTGYMPLVVAYSVMLVLNDKNEVLMEERSDDHFFDFPGGSIEFNEKAEDAAKRELFEETGLEAGPIEVFGIYSGPVTYYRYWDGHTISGVDIVYLTRSVSGVPEAQKEEVKSFSYYPLSAIPLKLSPRNKQIISDLIARLESK